MNKKIIAPFGLGLVAGIVLTLLCIFIMRKLDDLTNFVEETTYTQDNKETEAVSNTAVEETSDTETKEDSSSYEVDDTENEEIDSLQSQSIQLKDGNGEFTPEALKLAQKYCDSYNNGKWDGSTIIDTDTQVEIYQALGIIHINDQATSIRTDERIMCDNAIKSYMSGKWDGRKKRINGGHTIKIQAGEGDLLFDGYGASVEKGNLDIPDSAYDRFDITNFAYVPCQGTYVIIDKKLVKFLRGKRITLPGGKLSWKGFQSVEDKESKISDDESSIMYDSPHLIYNKVDKKLYLISGDKKNSDLINGKNYVYVFDDCNISKIRYLGIVKFEHQSPSDVDIEALINSNK